MDRIEQLLVPSLSIRKRKNKICLHKQIISFEEKNKFMIWVWFSFFIRDNTYLPHNKYIKIFKKLIVVFHTFNKLQYRSASLRFIN